MISINLLTFIFRPHRMHSPDAVFCDRCHAHRGLCVCLSVCVLITQVYCAKSAEPIEMPFGGWLMWAQRNHVLDGVQTPTGRSNFWGLSGPLKSIGSQCCGVPSKGIIQSSITARYAMQPFIEILWLLVSFSSFFLYVHQYNDVMIHICQVQSNVTLLILSAVTDTVECGLSISIAGCSDHPP